MNQFEFNVTTTSMLIMNISIKVKVYYGLFDAGLFDLAVSAEFISKEIVNCLILAREGLHAVVLVLSLSTRISQEEENALCTLQMLFGGKIVDYLIVVFTCGDMLEDRNMTLEDYLSNGCPEFLKV